MKNKNLTTLTVIALLLVLLTLIAVSGTYAKYTTTIEGEATAIIAKWNFNAKHGQTTLSEDFVIDLGATATVGAVPVVDGQNTTNKIQPGSKGVIEITIDNTASDVAASLVVTPSAIQGSPLTADQFDIDDAVITDSEGNVIDSVPAGETATATVEWEWLYESNNDAADTTVGGNSAAQAGTAVPLIGLTVTGFQANPQTVNP